VCGIIEGNAWPERGAAPEIGDIMRNTWKGMLLGALGGAAIGLALESIDRAARGANHAVHATPEVASRAGGRAKYRAVTLLHEGAGFAARAARKAADRAAERNGVHH
jgi:hypothetical protein